MLKIKDISYRVKDKILLDSISASFEPGKISGIIGSNGAGKSTLLKIISGEIQSTTGKIYLDNNQLRDYYSTFPATMRAVVSQHEALNTDITVTEYILLGRLIHTMGRYQVSDYQSVERALQFTGCLEFAHKDLLSLSGGERQRIQLARALVQIEKDPYVYRGYLFLDEFSANMDIYYQQQMLKLLKKLCNTNQLAIIIIAHDLNQIINYFDYCILLKEGKLIMFGTPSQVLTTDNIELAYKIKSSQIRINDRYYFIH